MQRQITTNRQPRSQFILHRERNNKQAEKASTEDQIIRHAGDIQGYGWAKDAATHSLKNV